MKPAAFGVMTILLLGLVLLGVMLAGQRALCVDRVAFFAQC